MLIILLLILAYLIAGACVGFAQAIHFYREEASNYTKYNDHGEIVPVTDYNTGGMCVLILLGYVLFWPVLWVCQRLIIAIKNAALDSDDARSRR